MTVIAPCRYNDKDQLLAPRRLEVRATQERYFDEVALSRTRATFDAKHYHYYEIDVYTADERSAQQKLDEKLARFVDYIGSKGRYRPIRRTRRIGTIGLNRQTKMSYLLVYAVE